MTKDIVWGNDQVAHSRRQLCETPVAKYLSLYDCVTVCLSCHAKQQCDVHASMT